MNEALTRKTNLFGAWCAVFYCVALLMGWWVIGGFFPLHKPSAGPEEIAAFFNDHAIRIRIGLIVVMWGSALFMPFVATLGDYIAAIEGRNGPLSRLITLAAYSNAVLTFWPPLHWLVAAFRPNERAADLLYLLNDMAWLQFLGGIALVMPMFVAFGVAVLNDPSPKPVFPRWTAFASFLVFILFIPDQLMFFYKTGPFAWNGLFAFWIPLTLFCSWFVMVFFFIRRDILGGVVPSR